MIAAIWVAQGIVLGAFMPPQTTLLPWAWVMGKLHLYNSVNGLILIHAVQGLSFQSRQLRQNRPASSAAPSTTLMRSRRGRGCFSTGMKPSTSRVALHLKWRDHLVSG